MYFQWIYVSANVGFINKNINIQIKMQNKNRKLMLILVNQYIKCVIFCN